MSTLHIESTEQHFNIFFSQSGCLSLPREDKTGLACLSTWLVSCGLLVPEEAAQMTGVSTHPTLGPK